MSSSKTRILVIFGTRPEAIKMAPVILELGRYPDIFDLVVCSTGQHREMLDQVLDVFGIVPDYDLDVMTTNQTLAGLTSLLISRLDALIGDVQPDIVLVHGDTTTALAGALAAYYHRVPVGHVEAGLRTHDKYQPFPEEVNRCLIDSIASFHFAPTQSAADNLRSEGLPEEHITVTGNTVIDALHMAIEKPCTLPIELDWKNRKTVLVTAHRRESFGEPLENICTALQRITARHPDTQIVYPVHYNPNVRRIVFDRVGGIDRIHLIDPLPYLEFVHLMARSWLILTDSGGIQEEAPSLGVPVLVLRDVTERPEAIEAGTVRVVGTDAENIEASIIRLIDPEEYRKMSRVINPYGDGLAARRIAQALLASSVLVSSTLICRPRHRTMM